MNTSEERHFVEEIILTSMCGLSLKKVQAGKVFQGKKTSKRRFIFEKNVLGSEEVSLSRTPFGKRPPHPTRRMVYSASFSVNFRRSFWGCARLFGGHLGIVLQGF